MKRSLEKELMDLPDKPRDLYLDDLRNLRGFNRYLGGCRSVIQGLENLAQSRPVARLSILDIGSASADIPLAMAEWARRRNIRIEIVALELEAMAAEEARRQTRHCADIAVVRGDGAFAPFSPRTFDVVTASQLLHHFSETEIIGLLRSWSQLARTAIIVSDLVRHPLAYHGIRCISSMLTRNAMTRVDAPLSVRRAFTLNEWRELFRSAGIGPFRISPMFPFRQMTVIGLAG
jgi:2-polyprenyl-3-methyl-5-hydroxy-6-metoxy-1,4-benzoquinol methylase